VSLRPAGGSEPLFQNNTPPQKKITKQQRKTNWSLFLLDFEDFFICSEYKSFIRHTPFNYFLPDCGLSFHFLNNVFQKPEMLNLAEHGGAYL
jgi:hypothetical protein